MPIKPTPHSTHMPAIAMMVLAMFLMASMDVTGKLLSSGYALVQFLTLRSWGVVVLLALWSARNGGLAELKTRKIKGHALRVLLGVWAPFLFFAALRELPLAEATVLYFCAPFILTALAVPLFGDYVGPHRWGAIIVGFLGVLVVVRPGADTFQPAALLVLGSTLCYAMMMLGGRKLSRTEPATRLVFYYNLALAAGGTLFLPFVWQSMPPLDIAVVALMALFSLFGHLTMTWSFNVAPAGVVTPFTYTALIWATLFGYLFWAEMPGIEVMAGAVVIIAAGLYTLYRETRLSLSARSGRVER